MIKSKDITFNIAGVDVPLNKMSNEHFVDYIRIVLGLQPLVDIRSRDSEPPGRPAD